MLAPLVVWCHLRASNSARVKVQHGCVCVLARAARECVGAWVRVSVLVHGCARVNVYRDEKSSGELNIMCAYEQIRLFFDTTKSLVNLFRLSWSLW